MALVLALRTWYAGLVLVKVLALALPIVVIVYGNMAQKKLKLYRCLVWMYNMDDAN